MRIRDERYPDGIRIVLIDFAFATMYLGDEWGFPLTKDLDTAEYVLESDLEFDPAIVERNWLPPLEYEY